MVEPRGLDIDDLLRPAGHQLSGRVGLRRGVAVGESGGNLQPQVVGQRLAHHGVAGVDLVAEAHNLDAAVAGHRVADAHHGVGEVDQPGVGTEALHVMRDLHDRADVAGGVGESPWPAVLRVGLAHAVLERDLEIRAPEVLPRGRFDGRDHEGRVLQRVHMIGAGGDGHFRAPRPVQAFGQPAHGTPVDVGCPSARPAS